MVATYRESRSRGPCRTLTAVALSGGVALSLIAACSRGGGAAAGPDAALLVTEAGTFSRAGVLQAFGRCATDTYRDFAARSRVLAEATARLEADGSEANMQSAQKSFGEAMDVWQRAEVFQFGPAGRKGTPGGQDMRDPIYSWPLVSRCLIEQALVSRGYAEPSFPTASLVNTRGLGAIEYLLFHVGVDNACGAGSQINASGSWAALGAAEIRSRKGAYASAASKDLSVKASALLAVWDPASGNFLAEMEKAGQGSQVFTTDQMAFNAVSSALFYIDDELKDMKLGKPLGTVDCEAPTCPEAIESPFAHLSKSNVRNNLLGFRMMFFGCGKDGVGLGFDDLLTGIGAGAVARTMESDFQAALQALDELPQENLEEALSKNRAGLERFHVAVRKLSTTLKTQVLSILDLELPKRVEGDND